MVSNRLCSGFARRLLVGCAVLGLLPAACLRAECSLTDITCRPELAQLWSGDVTIRSTPIADTGFVCGVYSTGRVSVATGGGQSTQGGNMNLGSQRRAISADGRYVVFVSTGSDLVAADTNLNFDAFMHDRSTGATTRVSLGNGGVESNSGTGEVGLSDDGRYVVFSGSATNLVAGDTNAQPDVFVYDRDTQTTTRATVSSGGVESNSLNFDPGISGDGRYVYYTSFATNLVAGDTNGVADIFVHDRQTAVTMRASVSSGGGEAAVGGGIGTISADGRYVGFESVAANLVAGDTNGLVDVFVHDRTANTTVRASVSTGGTEANGNSSAPNLSADGRYVVFTSSATNLVSSDTNGFDDVFLRDLQTGETVRVSISSGGVQGTGISLGPSVSADGRYVAFISAAANLVVGDTNAVNDAFVHDRTTGTTTRISLGPGGVEPAAAITKVSLSPTCAYAALESSDSNLVAGDTNGVSDLFVVDR